jgi:glycosyltransferase involved in cell wall biosynthesis
VSDPVETGGHSARPRVSVVLPVRNQGDHIDRLIDSFGEALRTLGISFELILVVNGSRDDTLEKCRARQVGVEDVVVIESATGWGAAVKAGLDVARGELVCYTNSARTKPADLALIIQYAGISDRVLVMASRKVRDSLLRRLGSVIFNFEARMLFGLAVWDINGTPKVLRRTHLQAVNLQESGDLIDLELMVACKRYGIPIIEVPTFAPKRLSGRSTTNLRSAIVMYSRTLWLYLRGWMLQ